MKYCFKFNFRFDLERIMPRKAERLYRVNLPMFNELNRVHNILRIIMRFPLKLKKLYISEVSPYFRSLYKILRDDEEWPSIRFSLSIKIRASLIEIRDVLEQVARYSNTSRLFSSRIVPVMKRLLAIYRLPTKQLTLDSFMCDGLDVIKEF